MYIQIVGDLILLDGLEVAKITGPNLSLSEISFFREALDNNFVENLNPSDLLEALEQVTEELEKTKRLLYATGGGSYDI